MHKKILIIVCLFASAISYCQVEVNRTDSLLQLKKPKRALHYYVNFDVVKVMVGHGWSSGGHGKFGFARSTRFQLLYPYSIFKAKFPIALGVVAGVNRINRRHAEYVFTDDRLTGIQEDPSIKKSVQKTAYFGIAALRVFRLKYSLRSWTLLLGPSLEINRLANHLYVYKAGGKTSFKDKDNINAISVPLHVQLSYSPHQFISGGFFFSYDTRNRFKGNAFRKQKQMAAGVSLALII